MLASPRVIILCGDLLLLGNNINVNVDRVS